jgi:hypothetical protein
MNAEDFDLATVLELVKNNQASNGEELEKIINGDSGINNVDIDGDGQIDYVFVKEGEQTEAGSTLQFWAVPSKTQDPEEAQLIATTSFSKDTQTNEITVAGGYPDYVSGYDNHYYSYRMPHRQGMTLGEAAFLLWAFDRHRPMYYRPYMSSYYVRRPYLSASIRTTRRTTYRTNNKITARTVQSGKRPASYAKQPSVTKAKSRYSSSKYAAPNKTSKTLGSRKNQSTAFSKRDKSKPQQKATGFGAGKKKKAGWSSSPKKKSGWGTKPTRRSPTRRSPSRSRRR